MKNSAIIKFFKIIILKFVAIYNDSTLGKMIDSVCGFFKEKSTGSVVCNYFTGSFKIKEYWKNSIAFKIITSPLQFVLFISEKFGASLVKQWQNSRIIRLFDNIFDISIREYAKVLLSFILGAGVGLLLNQARINIDIIAFLVLFVLSVIMLFVPSTIRAIYTSSKALKAFGSLFNFYEISENEKELHKTGNKKLIFSLLFVAGIVAGAFSLTGVLVSFIAVFAILAILIKPMLGILLFVVSAPIMPTMVCAGLVALSVVSYLIKLLFGKEKGLVITEPSVFIIGFLGVALFSSLTSFNISKSLQAYMLYFLFAMAYFLIVNNIKTRNQWYNLVVAFVLAGFLVGLYGVYQNYFVTTTDTSWIDEDMFTEIKTRVYSTFDNPNVLGQYLVMTIPVAFALFWSEKRTWAKLFYLGIVGVMMACLIFTWSRAAWVGIILALGFFMVTKDRRWASLLVVALLIMPFVLPESLISRITSIGNMKDSSTAYRFSVWLSSIRIAGDYWLSGIGLGAGAFERVYQKYALNGAGFALHSHNFYIQLVVEMGVLGIVLFALIMISSYRGIISIKNKNSKNKTVALAMGGALIGYMFQGIAENLWYNYRMILLFFIYIGILHSGANLEKREISANGIKE